MDKETIKLKIEKNRELIERLLSADLTPVLISKMINELKLKNDKLIEKLRE